MKSIIEREATFENNSDMEVKVTTLAFGSIGHGFESKHRLFSHHGASAFSKLRLLVKCSLEDSVCRLPYFTQLAIPPGRAN